MWNREVLFRLSKVKKSGWKYCTGSGETAVIWCFYFMTKSGKYQLSLFDDIWQKLCYFPGKCPFLINKRYSKFLLYQNNGHFVFSFVFKSEIYISSEGWSSWQSASKSASGCAWMVSAMRWMVSSGSSISSQSSKDCLEIRIMFPMRMILNAPDFASL